MKNFTEVPEDSYDAQMSAALDEITQVVDRHGFVMVAAFAALKIKGPESAEVVVRARTVAPPNTPHYVMVEGCFRALDGVREGVLTDLLKPETDKHG